MMKKQIKNLINMAFILILGFVFTFSTVYANSPKKDDFNMQISTDTDINKLSNDESTNLQHVSIKLSMEDLYSKKSSGVKTYNPIVGTTLIYWKISEPINGSQEQIETQKVQLIKKLKVMTYRELVSKYGVPDKTSPSGLDGIININLKDNTLYYFKDYEGHVSSKSKVSDFLINILGKSTDILKINSKNTYTPNDENDSGIKKFVKKDLNSGKPLEDAWFKVAIKNMNGKYNSVLKEDKEYIVKSDLNGEFEVKGLEFNKTYYLVEVKPPTGYSQLSEPVEFTVNHRDSSHQTVEIIFNKKNPYEVPKSPNKNDGASNKGIVIPKTGDIMLFLLVISGILVSSLGYLLTRDEVKKVT